MNGAQKASSRGVVFRASLYFLAIFLGSLGEKLSPVFFQDQWPSAPYTVGAIIVASGLAFLAVRAYFDGSAQRHSDYLLKNGTDKSQPSTAKDT